MANRIQASFVGVASPTSIYVRVADREQFAEIALPMGEAEIEEGLRPVLFKRLEGSGVTVIFQYWPEDDTP